MRTQSKARQLILTGLRPPSLYAEPHDQLVELIRDAPDLILDHSNKTYTRFMLTGMLCSVTQRCSCEDAGKPGTAFHVRIFQEDDPWTVRPYDW